MGLITIETPFCTNLNYLIQDMETAESLIANLDKIALPIKNNKSKTPPIKQPTVTRSKGIKAAFGTLNDKDAATLAKRLREANRQVT